jgi:hypothetical protein
LFGAPFVCLDYTTFPLSRVFVFYSTCCSVYGVSGSGLRFLFDQHCWPAQQTGEGQSTEATHEVMGSGEETPLSSSTTPSHRLTIHKPYQHRHSTLRDIGFSSSCSPRPTTNNKSPLLSFLCRKHHPRESEMQREKRYFSIPLSMTTYRIGRGSGWKDGYRSGREDLRSRGVFFGGAMGENYLLY